MKRNTANVIITAIIVTIVNSGWWALAVFGFPKVGRDYMIPVLALTIVFSVVMILIIIFKLVEAIGAED
jgi:ABC-type maltose transport system permease subunit